MWNFYLGAETASTGLAAADVNISKSANDYLDRVAA